MNMWKRLILLALALMLSAAALADDAVTPEDAELSITVSNKMHILAAGKTMQLTARFKNPAKINERAGNDRIAWRLEREDGKAVDPEWVRINGKGQLTTTEKVNRAYNVVVIAASAAFGTEARYQVLVYPPVREFSIRPRSLSGYAHGKALTVHADTVPSGLSRTIAWKSGNTAIARLKRNADGSIQVQPGRVGNTVITARSKTGIKRQVIINVRQPVTGLTILGDSIARQNEAIFLRANITPRNAYNKEVEWSLDVDAGIAAIDQNGRFRATLDSTVGETITVYCRAKGTDEELIATKEILIIYAWNTGE